MPIASGNSVAGERLQPLSRWVVYVGMGALLCAALWMAALPPLATSNPGVSEHNERLTRSTRFLRFNDYLFNGKEEKTAIAAAAEYSDDIC